MAEIASASVVPGARVTVADCLRLEPICAGRVVAGAAGLDAHAVDWVTVMEWPVEDFVARGELVLSTGFGCDERMFVQLADEVASAGAAALCVSVGERAPFPVVPDGIVELGDERGFPVIALDWEVRFADVTRSIVDRLLSAKYRAAAHPTDRLAPQFTDALLGRDGMAAIAQALEQMIGRGVAILDRGLVAV
ncbi:MAG: PucR family transcriptional regulator ligand-binding domain-containing protein, partial [Conexibacter sp.]